MLNVQSVSPAPVKQVFQSSKQWRAALAQKAEKFKQVVHLRLALVMLMSWSLLVAAERSFAQSIAFDTDNLFDQINVWIAALDDIIFLGVAIAIAIAVLTFVGSQILKAFRGN